MYANFVFLLTRKLNFQVVCSFFFFNVEYLYGYAIGIEFEEQEKEY